MNTFHQSAGHDEIDATNKNDADVASLPKGGIGLSEAYPSNAGYWIKSTGYKSMEEPKAAPRRRRPSGNEHVKHRRTRNGCYTCRNRRVKCDESHPVCQRCAKGKRECAYPEPRETAKSSGGSKRNNASTVAHDSQSSSLDDDPVKQQAPQGQRRRRSEPQKPSSSSRGSRSKATSTKCRAPSLVEQPQSSIEQVKLESSLSPSTDASSAPLSLGFDKPEKFSSVSTEASQENRARSHLSQDIQYYLEYHKTHLTFHHYKFKHDANHFLHHILVEQALSYEPLLYAVAGFAAFQSTVNRPSGRIQDFLGYYNKSVSLLRQSLGENQRHTDATMLTILQLATFEDYLGDLVSLLGHQRAAYGMLLELYSSHSILETEIRRKILAWYLRYDVMGGLMGGYSTVLGREWFVATEDYYRQQSLSYPMSIDYKIEATIASFRLLAGDLALLYAQLPRGDISIEAFTRECNKYSEQLESWTETLDPVFRDEAFIVRVFEGESRDPQDIVDPFLPSGLYKGALFSFNFMLMDWHALNLMHKYKTARSLRQEKPREVTELALTICRIFEAIEYWPESPPGAVIKAQGALGLAIVFLPRDQRHIMWCRRKLAKIESLGHIYPATLRHKMAHEWGVPEVNHWWLPDESACPIVVRSVRTFMEDRLPQAEGKSRSEDQRNIRGIFSKLSLQEDTGLKEENDRSKDHTSPPMLQQSCTLGAETPSPSHFADDNHAELVSDSSMLDQAEESFYAMADKDVEIQRRLDPEY